MIFEENHLCNESYDLLDHEPKSFPFDDFALSLSPDDDSISSFSPLDDTSMNTDADEYLSDKCFLPSQNVSKQEVQESESPSNPSLPVTTLPQNLPTMLLPSGTSVKILGALPPRFNLSTTLKEVESPLWKRKRTDTSPEEQKKAAKRQRNRVLAQQSRERKKKYIEGLEKDKAELKSQLDNLAAENEELKSRSLLSSRRSVVLCMLICVALLVVSQQIDEIPSRLTAVELPLELPKGVSHLDLILEQCRYNQPDLEKGLSLALPPSVLQSIRALPSEKQEMDSCVDEDETSSWIVKRLIDEATRAFNQKDTINVGKDSTARRKGLKKDNPSYVINHTNCDSEDSDEEHSQ